MRRRRCGRVCRLVGKLRLGAAARPGVVSGFPEHCCQWWGWRCRGFIPRAGCRPKAERQGVEAARPRRLATGQRPRGRRVSAFEQILRGAAPRRPLRETASPASPTRAVGSARRVPVFASPSAGRAPILGSSCSPDCHAVFAHVCRSRGRHSAAARQQKYAQNRAACALQHCRVWRRRPMACVGSACVSVCSWS